MDVVQNTFLGKESTACTEPAFVLDSENFFSCKPLAFHPLHYLLTAQAKQFWNMLLFRIFFLETLYKVSWKPAPAAPCTAAFVKLLGLSYRSS